MRSKSILLYADSVVGIKTSLILAENSANVKGIVLRKDISEETKNNILSPWKSHAEIQILSWDSLIPNGGIINSVLEIDFDVAILAWWPFILGELFLSNSKQTYLNMHPSYLPFGRGKDPNFWALVDKTPFGVSIHHVIRAVDQGAIAFQKKIPLTNLDNGETLYASSLIEMENLFREVCPTILTGDIPCLPQPAEGTTHKRKELEVASQVFLDRQYVAEDLINLLRARTFLPHPGCWFEKDGKRYEMRISITEK